jgi:tetratricopeptide (TPR) repeat protein
VFAVHIDIIETLPSLARLEDNWNAVYDADPEAQIFLSWKWLSGWLAHSEGPWFILAAKARDSADAPYVAFFPLRLQTTIEKSGVLGEVRMAGRFSADYTGIVCAPDAENKVIPAFARHIKQMHWARFNLDNVRMSERRFRLLLAYFPKANFQVTEVNRVDNVDGTDFTRCPYAALPTDWDSYLLSLSTNRRQKTRRLLRLVEAAGEYRITVSTAETFARDLKTLLRFWEIKWRPRKGDSTDILVRSNTIMLTRSFQSGLVFLPTFWHGDRPVAALATLIDERKRTLACYMTGRDETFEGPSPAGMLHAFSIRYAIENGFSEYDFVRGNASYKYSYCSAERKIHCILVETRNGKNLGDRIDPRSVPEVLQQATALHQKGQVAEAECGYRRILDVQPKHADALHRLGQLLAAKGNHAEAKRHFKALTMVRPDAPKAWLCLAQACESLGQHREAIQPCLEVMRLSPDLADGFVGLSRALVKLGRIEEVNNALLSALGCAAEPPVRNWRVSDAAPAVPHKVPEERQLSL